MYMRLKLYHDWQKTHQWEFFLSSLLWPVVTLIGTCHYCYKPNEHSVHTLHIHYSNVETKRKTIFLTGGGLQLKNYLSAMKTPINVALIRNFNAISLSFNLLVITFYLQILTRNKISANYQQLDSIQRYWEDYTVPHSFQSLKSSTLN